MTISMENLTTAIEYPHTDGLPMAESDSARIYLTYLDYPMAHQEFLRSNNGKTLQSWSIIKRLSRT